ncbi:DUF2321 domain-containing protein [Bradyrhizobium sp. AUGA SZCCT0177]|uniref:DUF2321 domain-containing protein n=1 Tax=Bradyrhizobium sp. AUGA SZCCT0177 TaxID=2807665 RepID=UPI001BAB93D2|nr:DUF2321 domain-containing protein [Bradyrhizobium sp. AUGA SZCCT0177]
MALSDSCFDFLTAVSKAAGTLAEEAHHYSAPDYPIVYGPEIDALRRAAAVVHDHPYDAEAGARLLRLASTIGRALDTAPGSPELDAKQKAVDELIRSLMSEVKGEEAASLPSIIENVTNDTPYTEKAAGRLKGVLAKVGKSTYDLAIKVLGDVATAAAKKWMGF